MNVSELGEFGLIDILSRMAYATRDREAAAWQKLVLGIGDDAAAWQGEAAIQLATTDALIQDIHFTLKTISWEELGWRALAANLSDIAAMGGLPRYALVSLALPGHTEVEDVVIFFRGMLDLAQQSGVAIIGGDTCSAPLVAINITVLGSAAQDDHLLTRSAARPGDQIAVTGYLGGGAAGLEILRQDIPTKPGVARKLKRAFTRPQPRVAEGQALAASGVKAAIDISDGLVADLRHICQASRVSARVETNRVPILPEVKASFADRALELALSGGEDYELLFTAESTIIDRVKDAISCPVTVIGEITEDETGKITLIGEKGQPLDLPRAGWEHFREGQPQP